MLELPAPCRQPPACLVSLPPCRRASARLTQALILLFSGRLGTLSTAFASPLGAPFTAPALASGDAPEPAVASGAWLGTRDPRRQLRQHHERHGHRLRISTYPLSAAWPARCSCPALPCPPGLTAPPLSSSSSESESHPLVFLPLSHPGFLEKRVGWPPRTVGLMRLAPSFHSLGTTLRWG